MNIRLIALTAIAATLTACGTTREPNTALEQARQGVKLAQGDTQVMALAPDELKLAQDALAAADRTWAEGGTLSAVDHLAYMTAQRVVIAQETASRKASDAVVAGAASERDQTRLALRTQEADAAQQKLALAQQSNAQKNMDLARGQAKVNSLEMQLKDLNAKQTDRGLVVTLGDVLFDTGESRLRPESAGHMAKLAAVLKSAPPRRASIEGYTDSTGSGMANLALSQRRADAVLSALLGQGVSPSQLTTRAHGQEQPVASNSSAAGRQMNRRVEIVFAQQPGDAPVN